MAATLDDIKRLLEENLRGGRSGGGGNRAGTAADLTVNVSSEELDEANESLGTMRENLEGLQVRLAGMREGTEEFLEVKRELAIATADYNKELKQTTDELKEAKKAQDELKKAFSDAKDMIVGVSSKMNDVQSFARELERTGAASKELSRMSIRLGDDLRLSGVSYEEVTKATKSLVANTTDFTMLSKDMQKSLISDASLFNEVGVETEQYTKNLQVGMKSMGMTAQQSAKSMREMRKTALALQVPVTQLMEDFAGAEEKMSQLGTTGIKSFKEMARIQKITGLEMGKLIAMTDKFDTFEGAADAAASLNAALGGNFVDSMSLMMEDDPAERFKIIRDAIESSGVAVEDMTRKQKMFMASQLELSTTDFTRAMSGDLSVFQDTAEGTADAAGNQIKTLEDSATLIRSQTELAANFAKSLEPAYGILADKAMMVTDDVSDKFYDLAVMANKAQKAIARMTPDLVAAAAGAAEGGDNFWEKVQGWWDGFKGIGITIASWRIGFKNLGGPIKDFFGKFKKTPEFLGPKPLTRLQKMKFAVTDFGKKAGEALGKAGGKARQMLGSIARSAKGIGGAIAKGPGKIAGVLQRLGPLGRGASKVLGAVPTTIASVGNMVFESGKGIQKAMATAGSDATDAFLAGIGGLGKGAAEAIDYMTFGMVDKLSTMTNSLGIGFNEAWEELDFSFLGETLEYGFDEAIKGIESFLGIASPSKVMMDIGMNMVTSLTDPIKGGASAMLETATALIEAFLAPWTTIGALLMEIIQPTLDMVPDSIKSIFMGDTVKVASELQTAAVDPFDSPGVANPNYNRQLAEGTNGQPQVINISLNLDGKEIDKKVINLVGGVIKEAVL